MSNVMTRSDPHSAMKSRAIGMHLLGTTRTDVRVLREATALVDAGYVVQVVDTDPDASRPREERHQGIILRHVLPPRWLRTRRGKIRAFLKILWMLPLRTRALLDLDVDAYHAHDAEALLACYIAGRLRRKPVVLDAHELPYFEPHLLQRPLQRRFRIFLLRRMLPRISAAITVSPPLITEMQQRYGGPPAVLVRNVPPYQPPHVSNRLREHLCLDATTRIALYQGALQNDRALNVLVRAARVLAPGIMLVLMGDGPSKTDLEALIQHEGLSDRVHLLPAVPYEELLTWTASADLGLIIYPPSTSPNVRYCLPNKLFEYLMVGLPVLASRLDAVHEILSKYSTGDILQTLEPEEIARAINRMTQDPIRSVSMRQNALRASTTDLNWEREQAELIALYARLFGMRRPEASEARHSIGILDEELLAPPLHDRMLEGNGVAKSATTAPSLPYERETPST